MTFRNLGLVGATSLLAMLGADRIVGETLTEDPGKAIEREGNNTLTLKGFSLESSYGGAGLDEEDSANDILILRNMEIFSNLWFYKGADQLYGDAELHGTVRMGEGDDLIGNFASNAPDDDNKLIFHGHVYLGDGNNELKALQVSDITGGTGNDIISLIRVDDDELTGVGGDIELLGGNNTVTAYSIANYNGGNGIDTIHITGNVDGKINLGGGTGSNTLMVGGNIKGSVVSRANEIGIDTVSIGGGKGDIKLGNGVNNLEISGGWTGSYTGGPAADTIIVNSTTISSKAEWDLKGGKNVVKGAGEISVEILMGDDDDTIGEFGVNSSANDNSLVLKQSINLKNGKNWVWASNASSITTGKDDDIVILGVTDSSISTELNLGEGFNFFMSLGGWKPGHKKYYEGGDGTDIINIGGESDGAFKLGSGRSDNFVIIDEKAKSNITSSATGVDSIIFGNGGKGDISLGDGINQFSVFGNWSGKYADGNGDDIIAIEGDWEGTYGMASSSDGAGDDTIIIRGNVKGVDSGVNTIDMGGDNSLTKKLGNNTLLVTGSFERATKIKSTATGVDNITIGEGNVTIDLGGGENNLTILKNNAWSGNYTGGSGNDSITLGLGVSATGDFSLFDGSNRVSGAGSVSGNITFGSGSDLIGKFGEHYLETHNSLILTGSVDLGSGNNTARIAGATTLTGAGGDDTVYMAAKKEILVQSLNLGGGNNKLFLIGRTGDPSKRKITLPLSTGSSSKSDTINICNMVIYDDDGENCDGVALETSNHSFNVVLDKTGGNAWEHINVKNQTSTVQSLLTVKGGIGFETARLNNLKLVADGIAGDKISFGGDIAIAGFSKQEIYGSRLPHHTLFELDFNPQAGVSDYLNFKSSAKFSNSNPLQKNILFISIEKIGKHQGSGEKSVTIAKSDNVSLIDGVHLAGQFNDRIFVNGREWILKSKVESGGKIYYLKPGKLANFANITDDSLAELSYQHDRQSNIVTISSSWSGDYTGGPSIDVIRLDSRGNSSSSQILTLSGSFDLGEGHNAIQGMGTITNRVTLGDGDDLIGNFGPSQAINERLIFDNWVDLGNGDNIMKAYRAKKVRGGSGDDIVILEGDSRHIDLKGGKNRIEANNVNTVFGLNGDDTVILAGSADDVDLGGGNNRIEASTIRMIRGGSGTDEVILTPGKSFKLYRISLGSGDNKFWIFGKNNNATNLSNREATIRLRGNSNSGSDNSLMLCNEYSSDKKCEDITGITDYAFNVVIDRKEESDWEKVIIKNQASTLQSILAVKGEVKIKTGLLNNLRIRSNNKAGDTVKFSGDFSIMPRSSSYQPTSGTFFELDVDPLAGAADSLVFERTAINVGTEKKLEVALKAMPAKTAESGKRISLVKILNKSLIDKIEFSGIKVGEKIFLNNQEWTIKSENAQGGGLEYYILAGDVAEVDNILGIHNDPVVKNSDDHIIKISGNLKGSYTGGSGSDIVSLVPGATVSGNMDLGGGHNILMGSGTISANEVKFGNGNDTIGNFSFNANLADNNLSLNGKIILGDGLNKVIAASATDITGGSKADHVFLLGDATGHIDLKGGENLIKAKNANNISTGDDSDIVILNGGSSGIINLGGGDNKIVTSKIHSLSTGSGNDIVVLKPNSGFIVDTLSLGAGLNKFILGGRSSKMINLNSWKVSLPLSNGANQQDDDGSFHLCNEINSMNICGDVTDSTDHSFNVALDASSGDGWGKVFIKNQPSTAKSFLSISGTVNLMDPEFHHFGIASNNEVNDKIKISGNFGITDSTIFELDFNGRSSDTLEFAASSNKMTGINFSANPVIAIKNASPTYQAKYGTQIHIVTAGKSGSKFPISGVKIQGSRAGRILLDRQIWEIKRKSSSDGEKQIYYLEVVARQLPGSSAAQSRAFETGGHVISAVKNATILPNVAGSQFGPGSASAPGVLRGRQLSYSKSLRTRFITGQEIKHKSSSGSSQTKNLFQFVNSDTHVFDQNIEYGRVSHFISLQFGQVTSSSSLRSTLSGIGYGVQLTRYDGMHFVVSALSKKLLFSGGRSNGFTEEFDLEGITIGAEAGQDTRLNKTLILSSIAQLTYNRFEDSKIASEVSLQNFQKLTGGAGLKVNYTWTNHASSSGYMPGNGDLYGMVSVSQDFYAGYDLLINQWRHSVDERKTWLTLDAGVSWVYGENRLYAETSSALTTSGTDAVKNALTLGFDLKW